MATQMANEIDLYVGQKLKAIRREQGVSQVALAEQIGVSYQQVQKYEQGINRISASKLYAVSKSLNCSVDQLFPVN